jgi:hypothetical protein
MFVKFVIDFQSLSLWFDAYIVHKTGIAAAPYAGVEFSVDQQEMFQLNQTLFIDFVLDGTTDGSVISKFLKNRDNSVGWRSTTS